VGDLTMKREIEFRGKTAKGEWVYGYHTKFRNYKNEVYSAIIPKDEETDEGYMDDLHPVIPETVGQYVGITDKNGKKIFEHDIVKRLYFNHEVVFGEYGDEPHTTIGFFTKENQALFIGEEDDFWYWGIDSRHEIEVLGNVFDNPELLNKIEYKGESDNGD
jgi:uncharacterized phage protein (TIGR01671 family)